MRDLDSVSANASFALSKDLVRGLMWLVNRRELMRTEFIKYDILPLYEATKLNHADFRYIIGRLDRILSKIEYQVDRRQNDLVEEILELHVLKDELKDRRDVRRSERPSIRASARSYGEQLRDDVLKNKIRLTDQEIETAANIFETIEQYFSDAQGRFGHDLGHFIISTSLFLRVFEEHGRKDHLIKDVRDLRVALQKYSDNREQLWRGVAEAFGVLNTTLRTKS